MYGRIILAGIIVALCGKAQSRTCNNTLVDERILQNTTAIRSLYNNTILCTNSTCNKSVNQFIEVATKITDQLAYIKDNEVFKFNRTVSFNDRNMNDTGQV